MMSTAVRAVPGVRYSGDGHDVPELSEYKCLTLRAGLVLPTCSWHYRAWLRLVGVEWAARALGLVPFAGMVVWRDSRLPRAVELRWPFAPHRPPRMLSTGDGERLVLTVEQTHVLADAIADIGRRDHADMVRRLAEWASLPLHELERGEARA